MMLLEDFHSFNWLNCFSGSRDSSVSVVTKVLFEQSGFRFPRDWFSEPPIHQISYSVPTDFSLPERGGGVKQPGMEPDLPPPSTVEVKSEWSYTFTPAIHLHGLPRGNFTCLGRRPHIGSVALPVLRDAHTDVQVCRDGTHLCARLYRRHIPMCSTVQPTHPA